MRLLDEGRGERPTVVGVEHSLSLGKCNQVHDLIPSEEPLAVPVLQRRMAQYTLQHHRSNGSGMPVQSYGQTSEAEALDGLAMVVNTLGLGVPGVLQLCLHPVSDSNYHRSE